MGCDEPRMTYWDADNGCSFSSERLPCGCGAYGTVVYVYPRGRDIIEECQFCLATWLDSEEGAR